VLAIGERMRHLLDLVGKREHDLDLAGQGVKLVDQIALALAVHPAPSRQREREQARATSCVVNALVEATPISGPARVISATSDSRTSELSGTLQIVSDPM